MHIKYSYLILYKDNNNFNHGEILKILQKKVLEIDIFKITIYISHIVYNIINISMQVTSELLSIFEFVNSLIILKLNLSCYSN